MKKQEFKKMRRGLGNSRKKTKQGTNSQPITFRVQNTGSQGAHRNG